MEIIDPEKFRDELASAIALIDLDMSKEGTTSNIIDRSARSTLVLLMSILKNSTENIFVNHVFDEVKALNEQVLRLKVELTRLKKIIDSNES